jgi:hypothetical protein
MKEETRRLLFVGLIILLSGINLGYFLMIPSRNKMEDQFKQCITTANEIGKAAKDIAKEDEQTIKMQKTSIDLCENMLDECTQTLGLLEGRSK